MKAKIHAKGPEIAVVSKGKEAGSNAFVLVMNQAETKMRLRFQAGTSNAHRGRQCDFEAELMVSQEAISSDDDFIFLMDPNSNRVEFDSVKNEAGINAFVLLGNAGVKQLEGRK